MTKNSDKFWETSSIKLHDFISKPEKFLSAQPSIAERVRCLTKELYDLTKNSEAKKESGEALPELIVERFDDEQVWQQLELQNSDSYDGLVKKVTHLMAKRKTAKAQQAVQPEPEPEEQKKSKKGKKKKLKQKQKEVKPKVALKHSVVDDKFFKLQQMEEFLLKEEKEEKVDSDDEEPIDLFADESDSENEDGGQYKDFFDPPEGEEVEAEEEEGSEGEEEEIGSEEGEEEGSDDFSEGEEELEDEEGESEDLEDEEPASEKPEKKTALLSDEEETEGEEEKDDLPKSSFEQRQERLQKKIEHIHNEALGEKPWQLQGEISSTTRPQNSLLEEVLQFDRTQRPAPVITEQTTIKLEDIIRQRIKDKAWDDVERKVKPVEEQTEYKKRLTLDQSKSKLSLAEIYEQDYLKQQEKANPNEEEEEEEKETPEQVEIKKMIKSLFMKLDALSNYHYTPKPAAADVKVITNLPAITVEEVAPVSSSDAALLAPEEVKGKRRGDEIGKEERTDTDKKRERRKKKAKQRSKKKAREAKEIVGGGTKAAVKRAIKEGRVKELQVTDVGAVKSSSTFFKRLQDEVSSSISLKKQDAKRKKAQENRVPAKKFKL